MGGRQIKTVNLFQDNTKSDGSVLIVEPMAGNSVDENFNPIGRTFSAASTLCCTANSIAQGGTALGAVASEAALKETVLAGGSSISDVPPKRLLIEFLKR